MVSEDQRKGGGEGVNNTEGRRRTGGIRRSEEGGRGCE